MNNELDVLQNCLIHAGDQLQTALNEFWPVNGQADIPTGTQAFFIAQALSHAGFFTYSSVQNAADLAEHIDALGIHRNHKLVVLVECKRLYTTEQGERLGQDWLRLSDHFQLPMCDNPPFDEQYRYFACLTTTCWNRKYMEWWQNPQRADCLDGVPCTDPWDSLATGLSSTRTLHVSPLHSRPRWDPAWFLGAIIPLSPESVSRLIGQG